MKFFSSAFLFFIALNAFASSAIEIKNPVIKIPPPGAKTTAMFLSVVNNSDRDFKIVKASGDLGTGYELHTMDTAGGMMKMRAIDFIYLKKKSITELKPGGLHIMIFGLKKPMKIGELHQLKLTLDDKSEIAVQVRAVELNHEH